MHTADWTTKTVTRREEVLDNSNSDKTDSAQSLFVLGSWGDPLITNGEILRALRRAPAADANAAALEVARLGLVTRQQGRVDTWVGDAANAVIETGRLKLTIHCDLSAGEVEIYKERVRVYDAALCHFFPDIYELQVRRCLHAERVKAANAATSVVLKWERHRASCLARLKNDTRSADLLKFALTPREDGLEITLWVAERRSERSLLEKDGRRMAEETWLSFVTNFITNDERMALEIPADQEMASFDGGNGHKLSTLETPLATIDTSTLKRFRQGTILSNALAKRVVKLAKFSSSSPSGKSTKSKKEILANEKTPQLPANQQSKTTGKKTFVPIENSLDLHSRRWTTRALSPRRLSSLTRTCTSCTRNTPFARSHGAVSPPPNAFAVATPTTRAPIALALVLGSKTTSTRASSFGSCNTVRNGP
jgi:hypothetical protein